MGSKNVCAKEIDKLANGDLEKVARLIDAMRMRPGFGEALFAVFHSFTDASAFERFMDEWEERRNEC